jgi:hypothetical protein
VDAAPTETPIQAYARDLGRRVATVVGTLRTRIFNALLDRRSLTPLAEPLFRRISRGLMRFQVLMALFAAGRLPRPRRGPHTGGFPHPENLLRGNPFPYNWLAANLGHEVAACGNMLEQMLAQPMAREILARVPAAERALRPLLNLLGCGPNDSILRRAARMDRLAQATYATVGIADPAPRGAKVGRPWPPIGATLSAEPALVPNDARDRLVPPSRKPP